MKPDQAILADEIEIRDQSGESFTAVWNWLLDLPDLSGTEKLVWIALKSYAGCPEIRPSVQKAARRAGVSVRTAQRAVIALSKKGLLRVERRSRPDGGFATNRYILLPSPHPQRTTGAKGRCHRGTYPPGDMMTPTPGDRLSPPQVTSWHHKENIKQIKDTTTTPLTPQPAGCVNGPVIGNPLDESSRRDFIGKALIGTVLAAANSAAIARAADKYHRSNDEVAAAIDVLDLQYRKSRRPIDDPTSLITAVLKDRIDLPDGYIPRTERNAEAAKRQESARIKGNEKRRTREAENTTFEEAKAKLSALSQERREELFGKAKAKLPHFLRNSHRAVQALAVEVLISKARAPANSIESEEAP